MERSAKTHRSMPLLNRTNDETERLNTTSQPFPWCE